MIFSPDMRYLLVQRRSSKKDFSGGKLSTSVAGHIGGSSKIVGQRISLELAKATLNDEVFEEAGLTELEYWFISRFAYQSHSLTDHISGKPIYANQEQVLLFYSKYKGSISPNLTEVDWMDWFSVKGIQKLTKQKPELFAPSFLKDLEVFTNRQIR
jgi:isopentenyldiphosphate isomerase